MDIKLLKQTGKNNCAQTAVAMLTGKSIEEIEGLYGHSGRTFLEDHLPVLRLCGFSPSYGPFLKYVGILPELALVRIVFLKRSGGRLSTSGKTRRNGHMVLWANGSIYDPGGEMYPLENMRKDAVIHSWLGLTQNSAKGLQ